MSKLSSRTEGFKDSIFGVMSAKAAKFQAINLSQGFPDFDGPEFVKKAAQKFIEEGCNQYAPFAGTVELRNEISDVYRRFYQLDYSSDSEITVTAGATEAIYLTIQAVVNPGDEVVIFEPAYDSYIAAIKLAGGIPSPVTLKGPDFRFDEKELKAALSPKTKLIIVNNPHNPCGRVFSEQELSVVASAAQEADCLVLSDEVYEHLVFDGAKHIPFASLPEMKERTITVSSAGKTFGLTGWKIGWTCAPADVSARIRIAHQFVAFCIATPLQLAVAEGLKQLESYLPGFRAEYQAKRDFFCKGLSGLGFDFPLPQGSYFVMLPIQGKTDLDDVAFCEKLIEERKVAGIPPSAFYVKSDEGKRYLRLCFAKRDEVLKAALENLQGL